MKSDYTNPRFQRIPASELRTAPANISSNSRLEIEYFDSLPDVLPNGLRRPDDIKAVAAFCLGGSFHAQARVEKGADGPVLAVEQTAYDLLLDRPETMLYSLSILRQLYTEIGRLYTLDKARRQARGAGRN